MFIPFGEWTPDLPSLNNPGSALILNVLPAGMHYEPFRQAVIYSSNGLNDRAQGAFPARDIDGTVFNFAGDATKLYRLSTSAYSDISRVSGGAYSTNADEQWNFTQFGRNVYATNFTDDIQVFTMGSSANFSTLIGAPPRARYMGIVHNDFLVLGDTVDGTYRVQWSPQGNPAGTWGTDQATLADFQDLASEYGFIRAVVGGAYGTIIQEKAITRMTFVGSPLAFTFDIMETGKGTQVPGSVCKVGNNIFYYGIDGFYFFDGSSSIPIGVNKVDKYFRDDFDVNYKDRVRTVADEKKQIIYMYYPSVSQGGAIMCYNYSPNAQKRWSRIVIIDSGLLCSALVEGYTLDSLDSLSGSIDDLTFSLDSEQYTGGQYSLAFINDNGNTLNYFNGVPMDAVLLTTEFQIVPGRRSEITLARAIIDNNEDIFPDYNILVEVLHRNKQSIAASGSDDYGENDSGYINMRVNDFYHQFSVLILNGFLKAQGIEIIDFRDTGGR